MRHAHVAGRVYFRNRMGSTLFMKVTTDETWDYPRAENDWHRATPELDHGPAEDSCTLVRSQASDDLKALNIGDPVEFWGSWEEHEQMGPFILASAHVAGEQIPPE